jgi:hypothetical protein
VVYRIDEKRIALVDRPRERSFFGNQAIRESRFESRLYRIICFHIRWDRVWQGVLI